VKITAEERTGFICLQTTVFLIFIPDSDLKNRRNTGITEGLKIQGKGKGGHAGVCACGKRKVSCDAEL